MVSRTFANQIVKLFSLEGMIEKRAEDDVMQGHLVMSLLKEKIEDGTFDVQLFN